MLHSKKISDVDPDSGGKKITENGPNFFRKFEEKKSKTENWFHKTNIVKAVKQIVYF